MMRKTKKTAPSSAGAEVYQLSLKELGEEKLTAVFNKAFKRMSLPTGITFKPSRLELLIRD